MSWRSLVILRGRMKLDSIPRQRLNEPDRRSIDAVTARAAIFDRINPGPHIHEWVIQPGQSRMEAGVRQEKQQCRCGAIAWRQQSGGKVEFVDVRQPAGARLVQDDIWQTPLPNGMLRWFGFDFDWAGLPEEPLLQGGERVEWTGLPGHFVHRSGISDAKVTVETDEFEIDQEADCDHMVAVVPKGYRLYVDAHGMDRTEVSYHQSWHDLQQQCKRTEWALDESRAERHLFCEDENGSPTEEACQFCSII